MVHYAYYDRGTMETTKSKLKGEIVRKLYESDDMRYAVLRLKDEGGREIVIRGALGGLNCGQLLEVSGLWEKHPDFGMQFKVESYQIRLPGTREGIIRFLGSGAMTGIRKRTAALIVNHFGEETLKVLSESPERLQEVPGIGKKKAKALFECWKNASDRRDSYIFLQGLGITSAYCSKLFKRYGDQAVTIVRSNPYRLAEEVDGIGFLRADEIAQSLGIANDSLLRMTAAAVYCANQQILNGNVCIPREVLENETAKLTGQVLELAQKGIDNALERRLLRELDNMIYTPLLAKAETELPELIASLALVKDFAGKKMEPDFTFSEIQFNEEQQAAVERVQLSPLSIITGGPGVGKTTVVGEIVRRAKRANLKILLAAPTGRAAKRLSESTGMSAKTLHRLLMFDPNTNKFTFGREQHLPCDLLIVDEVSMLDIILAQALFRAIAPGTSVVLVGDADQLPSVGPGKVLADFIQCGWFAVTALTQIFRQAENSLIVTNAHRVNRGMLPDISVRTDGLADFYWIEQDDPEKVLDIISRTVCERIPARFGFNPVEDVQILTPMNRGNCGTIALNDVMQKLLNSGDKPQFTVGERLYKLDDKLMQTVNNYDKSVFNGDLGTLVRINAPEKKFTVRFDGCREVEYNFDESDQLSRAYAVTVHKSQGCEFPAVVMPFLSQHYMMLQRNLLYTAMTRAKKLLVIVGSKDALRMAVENFRIEPRHSLLLQRLAELRKQIRNK